MNSKMKVPTIECAETLLTDAEKINPGPWIGHSRVAGFCAKVIAEKSENIDSATAYVLGLLHDIGRKFGVSDMRHTIDGYYFMNKLGYDDSAKICLTHNFPYKNIHAHTGENDCTEDENVFICKFLNNTEYDDYDKLIQLCDALAFSDGPTYVEKRLVDVALRRGFNDFTIPKWKEFLNLKVYFDKKTGMDIYKLLGV